MPDIRINSSTSSRRKMLPADANSMVAEMVDRLKHARNSASHPGYAMHG